MYRTRRLIQTGHATAVVIPKLFLNSLKWRRGDEVVIGLGGELLVVGRLDPARMMDGKTAAQVLEDALRRKTL